MQPVPSLWAVTARRSKASRTGSSRGSRPFSHPAQGRQRLLPVLPAASPSLSHVRGPTQSCVLTHRPCSERKTSGHPSSPADRAIGFRQLLLPEQHSPTCMHHHRPPPRNLLSAVAVVTLTPLLPSLPHYPQSRASPSPYVGHTAPEAGQRRRRQGRSGSLHPLLRTLAMSGSGQCNLFLAVAEVVRIREECSWHVACHVVMQQHICELVMSEIFASEGWNGFYTSTNWSNPASSQALSLFLHYHPQARARQLVRCVIFGRFGHSVRTWNTHSWFSFCFRLALRLTSATIPSSVMSFHLTFLSHSQLFPFCGTMQRAALQGREIRACVRVCVLGVGGGR